MKTIWKVKGLIFCNVGQKFIYLQDSTGKSRICYAKLGEHIHEVRVLENGKNLKKGFMVVSINGTALLVQVYNTIL